MNNLEERFIVLETKFDGLSDTVTEHMIEEQEERKEFLDTQKEIMEMLLEVRADLNRYRAFVGGIMWIISALIGAALLLWKGVTEYLFS